MSNSHETIADIIAEKRRRAEDIRNNLSTVPFRQLDQLAEIEDLEDEADRLEAAHKRELARVDAVIDEAVHGYPPEDINDRREIGDAAKLREALVMFVRAYEQTDEMANIEDTAKAYELARAALAAPARNCDRFASAEEAWDAYDEWVESYRSKGKTEPFNEFGWLFAPATEKEGVPNAE